MEKIHYYRNGEKFTLGWKHPDELDDTQLDRNERYKLKQYKLHKKAVAEGINELGEDVRNRTLAGLVGINNTTLIAVLKHMVANGEVIRSGEATKRRLKVIKLND